MVIFDCNGVLVDSEPLATQVASQEFMRAGFALTPEIVARYFTGRRPADMIADVEVAAGRRLPPDFALHLQTETIKRFRADLKATAHAAHALSWLRGPKCVASSSGVDRIRTSLATTGLTIPRIVAGMRNSSDTTRTVQPVQPRRSSPGRSPT